jgi:hypothetical protein
MVWHIFKKDWKLLWRMVVGVALINVAYRVMMSSRGVFADGRYSQLASILSTFGAISLLATGLLVGFAVQQDAIPGLRQDWLIRPIRRRDLLLSKLLFVALAVQGPILIAEIAQCLAAGLTPGQSLGAPLSRSIWMFLVFDLPLVAFATLTSNLMEAVGTGLAVVLGFAFFTASILGFFQAYTQNTAVDWVTGTVQLLWGVAAVAAVLFLQYYRRKTTGARWLWGASAAVWLMIQLMPWQTAFAIQERVAPQRADTSAVGMIFEPATGRVKRLPGEGEPYRVTGNVVRSNRVVYVPLRMVGVGNGRLLIVDQMTARLKGSDGRVVDLGNVGPSAYHDAHQVVFVPENAYDRVKDQPVRLEMNYSLSLMQADPTQTMPVSDGTQRVAGLGTCATRISPRDSRAELGCAVAGLLPCATWLVENVRTGQRLAGNAEYGCIPNYSPYFGRLGTESISYFPRLGGFAMDQSQLKDARVVFGIYRPVAHFTREVVIPEIRLADWRPE